jgi:hypothetical protein
MSISQRFFPGFLTILSWYTSWPYKLEAFLVLVGVVFMVWRRRSWMLVMTWTALYFVAYSTLGVSRYFWYYAPLVPGFVALVGLGVALIGDRAIRDRSTGIRDEGDQASIFMGRQSGWGLVRRYLPVALLALLVVGQGRSAWLQHLYPDTRYAIYRAAGEWLQDNTSPQARVAALEVGIIGYYARRPMVDFAGLIQPDIASHLAPGSTYEDAALWAVDRYHPDYLVLPQGVLPRLEQAYAAKDCTPIKSFDGKAYGYSQNMVIYSCHL